MEETIAKTRFLPRILVVHNRYLNRGGEDACREAECEMLRAHGHEVREYLRDNSEINLSFPAQISLRAIWSSADYRSVRQLIRGENIDVVHLHNYFPLISPSVYYAARDEHIPIIHTLHNYRQVCPGGQLLRRGKVCEECLGTRIPWRGILHGCYRESRSATAGAVAVLSTHWALGTWEKRATAYIAVSRFMRDKLIAGGLPANKILLKPNFIPDTGPGNGTGGYALFVGRLSEEKGITVLLSAWDKLRVKVPLKIVGSGPLESLVISKASNNHGIEYLGPADTGRVLQLMGDAIALLVPSRGYEGAPRVIVEALSRGTPVIASNLGGMSDMIEPERSGFLFDSGDADSLSKTVEQLAMNPRLAARLREGARQRFLSEFTEERNYQILLSIYRKVIAENGEP